MLTLDQIRAKLQDRRVSVVSRATGVGRNTIAGVRDGTIENPAYGTVKALSDYLEAADAS